MFIKCICKCTRNYLVLYVSNELFTDDVVIVLHHAFHYLSSTSRKLTNKLQTTKDFNDIVERYARTRNSHRANDNYRNTELITIVLTN